MESYNGFMLYIHVINEPTTFYYTQPCLQKALYYQQGSLSKVMS